MDMSKCLLFIFMLHLSHSCFPVFSIFICSMKILKSLLQFVFIAQCDHLFQVFIYLCEKGSYWIFFVFMFRMLLPYFMTVGPLGWEDVLPCASLSLPSLFCTHLLGHPKCFSSSLKISLTHNRCGARWGERAWKKNTSLSTAVQCLSPSNSMSMCWCRGGV